MSRLRRGAVVGVLVIAAIGAERVGIAFQRSSQSSTPLTGTDNSNKTSPHSIFDNDPYAHDMEEKRGKAMNTDRQRQMVKEANQLVQAAAELEAGESRGMSREEEAKRAETIEKLARNVKERMRGTR